MSKQLVKLSEPAGYLVSAPWRSSGKTMVSIGIARAAKRRSLAIQTFKKGPDYIDPLWLAAASGTGCYNLDPYVQQQDEMLATFYNNVDKHSLALVEGTMGLHDGLQSNGSDSNAAIACAIKLPVILVVDCRGMHRTVAALINGIQQFDANVPFAGVILNRVRSTRHEEKIRTAMQNFCDVSLLGVIPESKGVEIKEKQLGLTPAPEFSGAADCIDQVADLIEENCDVDTLFAKHNAVEKKELPVCIATPKAGSTLKIGLAKDQAFHFYYRDDLDTLRDKGLEVVELSPMHDQFPTDLDGFIIGGGFPERHAQALANNTQFREKLLSEINRGLVVHAECAGLMYLCRSLNLEHGNFDMVGAIAGDVQMCKSPQGRGYVQLNPYHDGNTISAHEFHHSKISFDTPQQFRYAVARGYGVDGENDGVQCGNAHASYAHFRHTRRSPWVDWFLQRIIDSKRNGLVATEVAS